MKSKTLASSVLAAIALCACSSSGGSSPPPSSDVSLRSDIVPVFVNSCATTSTCHGSPTGVEIYLASNDPAQVRSALVGVASLELQSMPYVTAGDPTKSYLMHKLDGDQAQFTSSCNAGDCGLQMPRLAPALDQTTRNRIRAWIAQGALDN